MNSMQIRGWAHYQPTRRRLTIDPEPPAWLKRTIFAAVAALCLLSLLLQGGAFTNK